MAIIAFLYYFFVVSGAQSLLGTGAREPPGGREAQAARAANVAEPRSPSSSIRKASPVERGNEVNVQENPMFKGSARDEAKQKAAVFTGGPKDDML